MTPSDYDLDSVVCIEADSTDSDTSDFEDATLPTPGSPFLYLVQYRDVAESGYGTESDAKPALPPTAAASDRLWRPRMRCAR